MKFVDFDIARDNARRTIELFEGGHNFPGLGAYDRVYALPDDCYGWKCVAIVRVARLSKSCGERGLVPLELHAWRRSGYIEPLKPDEMTAEQLVSCADIKRTVASWLLGVIDHLPPSTDRRWDRDGEH